MADAEASRPGDPLERGDTAPWFKAPAVGGRSDYAFDTVAGRHALMLFFDSAARPEIVEALAVIRRHRALFDDLSASFFGVSADVGDAQAGRIAQALPGIRFFLDPEGKISAAYRAAGRPQWVLLDPALRVLGTFPLDQGEKAVAMLGAEIAAKPTDAWAPVLMVPNVLPLDLCEQLIAGYRGSGGETSGFMREVDGKTVLVVDDQHKQRRDWDIDDESLRATLAGHLRRHLSGPIQRFFQFRVTRMERYVVACYEAGAGHFRPHRDNTTRGTAHRRFAVTINLNAGDYDGGDLRFPEFGQRTYRAPTGGAIVFSCSMLHEATHVTRGTRYAFLPFLYDEAAARQREANNAYLGDGLEEYKSTR
jgi:predicted 2-oxoglutarate/Fe(II)-dependent dioxygenase YbiX/peroxiredoxin